MNQTTILITRTALSAVYQMTDSPDNAIPWFIGFTLFIFIALGAGSFTGTRKHNDENINNIPMNDNPSSVHFNHDNDSDESFGNRGNLPNDIESQNESTNISEDITSIHSSYHPNINHQDPHNLPQPANGIEGMDLTDVLNYLP